jgi:hypothetical protein
MARSAVKRYARGTNRRRICEATLVNPVGGLPMTIALDRSPSLSRIMQRHDATWDDYVALRDS